MNDFERSRVIEEIEKDDWGNGDLCLFIGCTKCDAQFELNNMAVTIAIGMNIPFIEYVKYVQNSKCPVCNK